jgi:hypothetical protein
MVLEADPSGVTDSLMKTSNSSTKHSACQWQTLEKTPMAASSSSQLLKLHGLMESTQFSEASRAEKTL